VSEPPIARAALPNDLTVDELRIRSDDRGRVEVGAQRAGWRYLSFETTDLADGASIDLGDPRREEVAVIVGGGALLADVAGRRIELAGRSSPFEGLPWGLYVPGGEIVRVTARARAAGGAVAIALANAPLSGRDGVATEPIVITPDEVRVEIRGAGNATRQINHIITPDFPADRLEVVEVLTPSGNWSSWPPHKHDVDDMPNEAVLEEVYYYRFPRPEAWGVQRVYRADRSRDGLWEVRTGDVVLVTDGYHPFTAAHGDDAWYLNALAGDRRTMACSFDPDLDWVRATWASMEPDPRLPLVSR
jgi:5-deoxy-glucuronate isomerase